MTKTLYCINLSWAMTLETSTTEYNLIEPTEIKNEVRVYIANILHS